MPPVGFTGYHLSDAEVRAAEIVYQFHQLRQTPIPADVVIALGTNDLRVAEYAADLFLRGYGKWLLCTGGVAHQGDLLETPWGDRATEAEMYAEVAARKGVPRARILLEKRARNTAENLRFSREVVREAGLPVRNVLVVVKPFMERRAWATFAVEWPEMAATVASQPELRASLQAYCSTPELPLEKIVHILMGDLQRIWVYGAKGWSAAQRVPEEVMDAYRMLKAAGWTRHLLAPTPEGDVAE
jgi:hypothetical protein